MDAKITLERFPVGSRWYDCALDVVWTVVSQAPGYGVVGSYTCTETRFSCINVDKQRMVWDRSKKAYVLKNVEYDNGVTRERTETGYFDLDTLRSGRLVEPAANSEEAGKLFHAWRNRDKADIA